jgi:hypothetical protein
MSKVDDVYCHQLVAYSVRRDLERAIYMQFHVLEPCENGLHKCYIRKYSRLRAILTERGQKERASTCSPPKLLVPTRLSQNRIHTGKGCRVWREAASPFTFQFGLNGLERHLLRS